jgi:polar amino acid transport system substrate-binding protein
MTHVLGRGLAMLVLGIAAAVVVTAQTPPLRLVSTAWSPFTNVPGQPRFALDLVEASLDRLGVRAATTIVEPADFTASLLSGKFDGSAAAWKDEAREKALLFSQPYLENRLVLVGRSGSDVSAKSLGDIKGRRVAIVGGYAYGENLDAAGPVFVRAATEEDSLKRLLASEVDYTLMDELVVQFITENYPAESKTRLRFGTTSLLRRLLYFAIRRDFPGAEALMARFNSELRGMIADGTYHRLLHVDWIRTDLDGDGVAEYVPKSERAGASAPQHAYDLFVTSDPQKPQPFSPNQRILIGGSVYDGWTRVPDRYKVEDPKRPDPNKATAGIFRFVW